MICPRCNIKMKTVICIGPNRDPNARYIVPQIILNNKTIELNSCAKCPKCGMSVMEMSECK